METQLSGPQRAIIEAAHGQGHLLVIAAPGSGKTRVITERVGYLLEQKFAEPEQIVVMTFTEKAAKELLDRLDERLASTAQGIQAGTIHAICNHLLDRHGAAVGINPACKVYDAQRQEEALRLAAAACGHSLEGRGKLPPIKEAISRRKRRRFADDQPIAVPGMSTATAEQIAQSYNNRLKESNALDFDDLILKSIELLATDQDAAAVIHQSLRYIFIDEFHDVSPEQFDLLTALAPPTLSGRQVLVVADPNQAIYGWRDADAGRLLAQYHYHYHPTEFLLEENYRSAGNIARAAYHLIAANGAQARITPVHPDELPIDLICCAGPEDEARWLARQIRRAQEAGKYRYSDMAVLYRANWRVNLLEITLLREGIPLQRHQNDRFFDHPDVQATLRYLSLIQALRDEQFEPSLHWPRVIVDELTMASLQRLAAAEQIPLSTLARSIDRYASRVSPLTRTLLKDFLALFDQALAQVAGQPIAMIVQRLLAVLKRHRSPITSSMREQFKGLLERLEKPLEAAVGSLYQAVATGRPIVLAHTGDIDAAAGALIIAHCLTHYLQHSVELYQVGPPYPADAFIISFGERGAVHHDGFGLDIYQTPLRTVSYSISTQAWRISQMLLMRYETERDGSFMIFDLETTGTHIRTTEILEMAALEVVSGRETAHSFHEMARPEGRIAPAASRVHGITDELVRGKPAIDEVLPAYLAFLGDATLVGHNVAAFDYPVLARIGQELGLTLPTGPLIDTYKLAQRLLPDSSHRLESLAHQFGSSASQTHRAFDDVRLNANVFFKLLDLLDREREVDAMSEALLLVALGMRASGVEEGDYSTLLAQAGARAQVAGLGAALTQQLTDLVVDSEALRSYERWLAAQKHNDAEEDRRWNELALRWQETLSLYKRTFDDHSLGAFLSYVELAASIDPRGSDHERVTLMTIHAAKGMEWPLVFVVGTEDDSIPDYHAKTSIEVEEERRILFVAMTRAKRRLCLSHIETSNGYPKKPSRFLKDIPEELLAQRVVGGVRGGWQ